MVQKAEFQKNLEALEADLQKVPLTQLQKIEILEDLLNRCLSGLTWYAQENPEQVSPVDYEVHGEIHDALDMLDDWTQELNRESLCECGQRFAEDCEETWGPACDLGNNPAHVKVHVPPEEPKQETKKVKDLFAAVDAALSVFDRTDQKKFLTNYLKNLDSEVKK